jgi:hypothetical protein
MKASLHPIADKYLNRLNANDKDRIDDYWKPVIEPASPKEIKMVNERLKDYEADPSSFVPFKRRKKG